MPADETTTRGTDFIVGSQQTPKAFPLVHDGQSAEIVFDANDAAVVKTVAEALAKDIALVTGVKPGIRASGENLPKIAIIMGSMEGSSLIKAMCNAKKIPADRIQGKWETFLITVVEHPLEGVDRALVIAGSDPRGAATASASLLTNSTRTAQ